MNRILAIAFASLVAASPAVGNLVTVHPGIGQDVHDVPPTGLKWMFGYRDGETRMDVLPIRVPANCELHAQIDVAGDARSAWVRLDSDAEEGRWTARNPTRTVKLRNRSDAPARAELVVAAFGKNRSRVDTRLSLNCHAW